MTGVDASLATKNAPPNRREDSLAPPREIRSKQSRFVRYIIGHGWIHLMLLTGVAIFLFPFAYMFLTSMKTDEELIDSSWFPAIPHYVPKSPYVRSTPDASPPMEAQSAVWEAVLPQFRQLAKTAIDAAPLPAAAESSLESELRAAATNWLITRTSSRLNIDLWAGEDYAALIAAYKAALTPDAAIGALDDRLARLEFRALQARSLDAHTYTLIEPGNIAKTCRVETFNGYLLDIKDGAVLRYDFREGDKPLTLSCEFDYPAEPARMHKLILGLTPDDSWHQVDATLDLAGTHWVSTKTKYLGTTRNQSILFQLPSFDDTTDRKRIWVPMERVSSNGNPLDRHGVLRVTITPSSTLAAVKGKIARNYGRVFDSIPFWRYVGNSAFLVVLTTLGALFSSSFVAYAFARLNWPGRSVAFGILLATMMLPAQVTMIPGFMIWRATGQYNTMTPLWLPAWFGIAFFIFLMVQHMRTIPRELEEAARIDGASVLRTWAQIILPETKPALAAIAIMVSMASWNEFMGPLVYLRDQVKFPLSIGLYAMRLDAPEGGIDWTLLMSGNVLMTLPVLVIFFLFQRYFIQGMTMSGMKG